MQIEPAVASGVWCRGYSDGSYSVWRQTDLEPSSQSWSNM